MMSSLSGMVTDAPPNSGDRMTSLTSSALSVSRSEYSWGSPVCRNRVLCRAGDLEAEIGFPKRWKDFGWISPSSYNP
jgi:predicted metalloendopeptidase